MKVLVLTQAYPSETNKYAMGYVHSRCVQYLKIGVELAVVNFTAKQPYAFEGVNVYTKNCIDLKDYDFIISHAPNLKSHIRFLWGVDNKKIVFVFHGHEVLKKYTDYPQPYAWNKPSQLQVLGHNIYDTFKIFFLRKWFRSIVKTNKVGFIFVSEWMKAQFDKNVGVSSRITHKSTIIPNPVYGLFLTDQYRLQNVEADFITIRPLDDSKYGVDLVVELAKNNPALSFHIYGKGNFFSHCEIPSNVKWFDCYVSQQEIPALLNNYRVALMPTRYDSQGVMACEMASFGIPLVTTNAQICIEMLSSFENVSFMDCKQFLGVINLDEYIKKPNFHRAYEALPLAKKEIGFLNGL